MKPLKEVLGDELFKTIESKLKAEKVNVFAFGENENPIPNSRLSEETQKVKDLTTQVQTLEGQLKTNAAELSKIKESSGDVEAMKKQIEELETSNKTIQEEADAKYKDLTKQAKIDRALREQFGAKDVDVVKAKIDVSKVAVDGDNLVGLKDQIEPLQKSHDWMFGEVKLDTPPVTDPNPDDDKGDKTAEELGKLSVADYMREQGLSVPNVDASAAGEK